MLYCTGTGYLGLQNNPEWLSEIQRNLAKFGSNHPISRLNEHDDFPILEATEELIAHTMGSNSACLISSGYLAGVAICRYFAQRAHKEGLRLLIPANHHPCLAPPDGWPHTRIDWQQPFPHPQLSGREWVAFGQTLDPFYGQPDASLTHPLFSHAPWRVIDCSHSMGLWDHRPWIQDQPQTIFVGSLGKAWAFPGGFIAGPKAVIAEIKRSGEYCAAAPPSIAYAAAFLKFASLRARLHHKLWHLLAQVDREWHIDRPTYRRSPIYHLGHPPNTIKQQLENSGFRLSWLRYPKPDSPLHLRLVLNASHDLAELDGLFEMLRKCGLSPNISLSPPDRWTVHYPA